MDKLPGDYIAGFVDGEGCFVLNFRRDIRRERKNTPVYFYWKAGFAISLREDDRSILEMIKNTLACGKISVSKDGNIRYSVDVIEDLIFKITPFFEQYRLRAKKKFDFELWKEAVQILYKNKGLATNISSTGHPRGKRKSFWNASELNRINGIHKEMKKYKSQKSEWKWVDKSLIALSK